MAASNTQKKAKATAKKTTSSRGSVSRASTSQRSGSGKSTVSRSYLPPADATPRARTTAASRGRTDAAAPRARVKASGKSSATGASTKRTSAQSARPKTKPANPAARKTPGKGSARPTASRGWQHRAAIGIVLASVVAAVWFVYPVLQLHYEEERKVASLQAELETLQERNAALRDEMAALSTPEGVERLARESLGYVKPGEQAYLVTGGEGTQTAQAQATSAPSFWQRAIDAVFGSE